MTHTKEREQLERSLEFKKLFLNLNKKGQDAALTVLQSLTLAQQVMCSKDNNTDKQSNKENETT